MNHSLVAWSILLAALLIASPVGVHATASSRTKVLASGQLGAYEVQISGSYVYWSDWTAGTISRVPLSGGAVQTLYSPPAGYIALIWGFVVSNGFLYWSERLCSGTACSGGTITNFISKILEAGGPIETLANISYIGYGIAVAGSFVYYIDNVDIKRVPIDGGTVQTLANDPSPQPWSLTVSGKFVYWYDLANGDIGKVGTTGGNAEIIGPLAASGGSGGPYHNIAVANGFVYWTHENSTSSGQTTDALYRVPTAGGTIQTLLRDDSIISRGLAVDTATGHVILARGTSCTKCESQEGVWLVPITGGNPAAVVSGLNVFDVQIQTTNAHTLVVFTTGSDVEETNL